MEDEPEQQCDQCGEWFDESEIMPVDGEYLCYECEEEYWGAIDEGATDEIEDDEEDDE